MPRRLNSSHTRLKIYGARHAQKSSKNSAEVLEPSFFKSKTNAPNRRQLTQLDGVNIDFCPILLFECCFVSSLAYFRPSSHFFTVIKALYRLYHSNFWITCRDNINIYSPKYVESTDVLHVLVGCVPMEQQCF